MVDLQLVIIASCCSVWVWAATGARDLRVVDAPQRQRLVHRHAVGQLVTNYPFDVIGPDDFDRYAHFALWSHR
jgi:hypothetical protein